MAMNSLGAYAAAALLTGNDIELVYKPCDCGAEATGSPDHHPECSVIDVAGAVRAEPPHQFELERLAGFVRAVCTTCGWRRFGGWHSARTPEGERLAEQDGQMHLRNPEIPAYRPQGW